jgi:hypothetical protein
MGSFGELHNNTGIKYQLQGLNTELHVVYFGIKKTIEEKKGVNIDKHVEKNYTLKYNKMEKIK